MQLIAERAADKGTVLSAAKVAGLTYTHQTTRHNSLTELDVYARGTREAIDWFVEACYRQRKNNKISNPERQRLYGPLPKDLVALTELKERIQVQKQSQDTTIRMFFPATPVYKRTELRMTIQHA